MYAHPSFVTGSPHGVRRGGGALNARVPAILIFPSRTPADLRCLRTLPATLSAEYRERSGPPSGGPPDQLAAYSQERQWLSNSERRLGRRWKMNRYVKPSMPIGTHPQPGMQTRNTIFTMTMPSVITPSQASESSGEEICRLCGVIILVSRQASTSSEFLGKAISGSRNT